MNYLNSYKIFESSNQDKLGPNEWKFDKRVSRIKITFESEIS